MGQFQRAPLGLSYCDGSNPTCQGPNVREVLTAKYVNVNCSAGDSGDDHRPSGPTAGWTLGRTLLFPGHGMQPQ